MGTGTKKISLAVLGTLCCVQLSGSAMAGEDKPTANLSVSALSKYVWRGFAESKDSLVLQPSMTVAYKGVSANLWGNVDSDLYSSDPAASTTNSWTETDFTLAYDWNMGQVGLTAGYIYYGFDGIPDTQEVFARATWHTLLTPTLTVYRDYDNLAGWYLTLGVSHSVPITEKLGLSLGAQVGYLDAEDASSYPEYNGDTNTGNAYNGFHDGLLSASVAIPVTEYISITPSLNYSFPLTSDAGDLISAYTPFSGGHDNFVYGGITAAMAF
ncbi:MAG: hypothetical protein PHI06_10625 [Desulfobulbaceae bacterium]|nr:hypothetical protein [Desulfobulbaceae bacterium]